MSARISQLQSCGCDECRFSSLHTINCDTLELDKSPAVIYELIMTRFVTIFVFAALTAFAGGSVANVTSATTMSLKMALADGGAMDMADCQGCGSDSGDNNGGIDCDMVCVAPILANLNLEVSVPAVIGISPSASAFYDLVGRTGPPEPYPPRTLI